MFSREELHYSGTGIGEAFLDTPGTLQLDRITKQLPGIFLQSNAALSVPQNSSVVINDWSAEHLGENSLLYQYIALLLSEGFPVYQVQGDALIPIQRLSDLKIEPSNVLFERSIYKLLDDHKLEKDKVYLLNHDKIAKLCSDYNWRRANGFQKYHIEKKRSHENQNAREEYNKGSLTVCVSNIRKFDSDSIQRLGVIAVPIDKISNYCNPDNLEFLTLCANSQKVNKEIVQVTPKVNTVHVEESTVSLDVFSDLEQLETLIVGGNVVWEHINTVLPNVKQLIFRDAYIDAVKLEALFQCMPNLEILQFRGTTIKGEFQNFKMTSLKMIYIDNLENYKDVQSNMHKTVLSTLVNQSPNLEILKINCEFTTSNFTNKRLATSGISIDMDFTPNKSLRLLTLEEMIIETKAFESLLSESLVFLELKSVEIVGELTLENSLSHLSCLKVKNVTGLSIENIITKAPNLDEFVTDQKLDGTIIQSFNNLQCFKTTGKLQLNKGDEVALSKWLQEPSKDKKWIITDSIQIKSADFEDIKNIDIQWQNNMRVTFPTFNCFYTTGETLIKGKITPEKLIWLLGTFPKNIECIDICNLEIEGDLTKYIETQESELLSYLEKSSFCSKYRVRANASTLFSFLKPEEVWLYIIDRDSFQVNPRVKHIVCQCPINQQNLEAINKAFTNLNRLALNKIVFDKGKSPTIQNFNVEHLDFQENTKDIPLLEIISLFPKLKELSIGCFFKTLLLDFKKYCPELEKIELGRTEVLKLKDFTYFINALPKGCQIVMDRYSSVQCNQMEWDAFLKQYPQVKIHGSPSFKSPKEKKESDFTPHVPNDASLLDPNWNQGMLINRLLAYLDFLMPKEEIPSTLIKKGICKAVSKCFADTVKKEGLDAWNKKWQLIKSWDKQLPPLENSPLGIALKELHAYVLRYQFEEDALGNPLNLNRFQIITNDLNQFLENRPKNPLFIDNGLHNTCLIYQDNQWIYLDPNYKSGEPVKFNTKEEVEVEIKKILGKSLKIISFDEALKPCWNERHEYTNDFLETGGFFHIIESEKWMEYIKEIPLSKVPLEGLFLFNTSNVPCWYIGLTQKYSFFSFITGNPILEQTLSMFVQYAQMTSEENLANSIKKGVAYLSEFQRATLKDSLSQCKKMPNCIQIILNTMDETPLPVKAKETDWKPEKFKRPELSSESKSLISKKSVQVGKKAEKADNKLAPDNPNTLKSTPLPHPFLLNEALANYKKNPIEPLETNPFKTWKAVKKETVKTLDEFDDFLFNTQNRSKKLSKNLLLHIPDNKQLLNYVHHLEASPLAKSRGLFVINSFEELRCAIASFTMDEKGQMVAKPPNSGALFDFLMEHKNGSPIIVINWCNFTSQQRLEANTIIEKHRHVDTVLIPKDAIVLSVQNPKDKNAYLDGDFRSRHLKTIDFPSNVSIPEVAVPQSLNPIHTENCVLELFNDNNWEAFFLGRTCLTEKGLLYEKSPLLLALEKKPEALNLILRNAPFHNPKFKFAYDSLLSKGSCTVNGQLFELPKNVSIILENGYDFKDFPDTFVSVKRGYLSFEDDCVLNTDNVIFFENYEHNPDTKQLITLLGLLENYKNQTISLCLTSEISLATFAKLKDAAKTCNTQIRLKVAPGISLPKELSEYLPQNEPESVFEACSTRIIVSNDIHYSEKILQEELAPDMCIDISEETKDCLFYSLTGKLEGSMPLFNETTQDIWKALLGNKRVLLKGHFAKALVDALAFLLKKEGGIYHNGKWEKPTGELILLSDSAKLFPFVSQIERKEVSFEDKMTLLGQEKSTRLLDKYSKDALKPFSYNYLNTLARTKELPNKPEDLIKPLIQLPKGVEIDEDYGLEEEKSKAFKEGRRVSLKEALIHEAILFLSGETGTGKSSFMHDLEKDPHVFVSFGDIEAWLNADKTNELNILFIDEANLVKTDWLRFEGLYSDPPSIYYKGKHYPLDANFKVVFAGNPTSYSQGRRVPELFQNHPNAVVFGAMNNAYLYHEVLKPILENQENAEEIARIFLKTFQMVKSVEKDAISARELQMMAYLFKTQLLPKDSLEKAKNVAFKLANHLLPEKYNLSFKSAFEQLFGRVKKEIETVPESMGSTSEKAHKFGKKKMLVTPSHQGVYSWLKSFIDVRKFKQNNQGKASYGGLTALIMEGEPGVGKSNFAKEFLIEMGLHEKTFTEDGEFKPFDYEKFKQTNPKPSHHFYHLPVSLSPNLKIDLLTRAFHEGAVVIMDEINSTSVLEELTNALLMGKDLNGRSALVPGFTLIGTQNPSSMAGRVRASLASDRRVLSADYATDTPEELVDIVAHKGMDKLTSACFVYEMCTSQYFARKNNIVEEPCCRDLFNTVKIHQKASDGAIKEPVIVELPVAEVELMNHLDLDNLEHQKLILELRKIGYENFFYVGEDHELYFLPGMQPEGGENLLVRHYENKVVSHLQDIIKCFSFKEHTVIGNVALKDVLIYTPVEDLALFLKSAHFEEIDFLQLTVDLNDLEKERFNLFGKVFNAFCMQIDEKTASNLEYKKFIKAFHPESSGYSKNRFFAANQEKEIEKEVKPRTGLDKNQ